MDAEAFKKWIEVMGYSDSEVARQLDIARNTVAKYKEEGAPAYIGLACAALAAALPKWQWFGEQIEVEKSDIIRIHRTIAGWNCDLEKDGGGLVFNAGDRARSLPEMLDIVGRRFVPV